MRRLDAAWLVGLVAGLAAVSSLLLWWQVPGGRGAVGADIRFVSAPTGALAVSPSGDFLAAVDLQPGHDRSGTLTIVNQTARPLTVSLRMVETTQDLDDAVRVIVRSPQGTLADGPLGIVGSRPTKAVTVASGQRVPVL
ncbi:MAG: hypothetical protein QOG34_2005, partial [Frankiaceae bacterium]|nr:hypothetical protein [Frankiaceae bacterium]